MFTSLFTTLVYLEYVTPIPQAIFLDVSKSKIKIFEYILFLHAIQNFYCSINLEHIV